MLMFHEPATANTVGVFFFFFLHSSIFVRGRLPHFHCNTDRFLDCLPFSVVNTVSLHRRCVKLSHQGTGLTRFVKAWVENFLCSFIWSNVTLVTTYEAVFSCISPLLSKRETCGGNFTFCSQLQRLLFAVGRNDIYFFRLFC